MAGLIITKMEKTITWTNKGVAKFEASLSAILSECDNQVLKARLKYVCTSKSTKHSAQEMLNFATELVNNERALHIEERSLLSEEVAATSLKPVAVVPERVPAIVTTHHAAMIALNTSMM